MIRCVGCFTLLSRSSALTFPSGCTGNPLINVGRGGRPEGDIRSSASGRRVPYCIL